MPVRFLPRGGRPGGGPAQRGGSSWSGPGLGSAVRSA